jgi:hypothetical protein
MNDECGGRRSSNSSFIIHHSSFGVHHFRRPGRLKIASTAAAAV